MICSTLLHYGLAYKLGHDFGTWLRCLALAGVAVRLLMGVPASKLLKR